MTVRSGKKLLILSIVVLLVGTAGSILYLRSRAASVYISAQPENGTPTGDVRTCPYNGASGGEAVKFGVSACREYANPVKPTAADPGAVRWNGRYYMVLTSGVPTFKIFVSDDMVNWEDSGRSVFDGTHPWGTDRFWAPEIHVVGNKFAVYYSAGDRATGKMSIGVATADNILGPYQDLGRPLLRDTVSVIDAHFFRDGNDRQYLYWKEQAPGTHLMAQELGPGGTGLIGSPRIVLQRSLVWEGGSIEAPWITKNNGFYYLFYSGEAFRTSKYAVGVAKSANPMGPFTKHGPPILTSSARWKGPGHNSVVSTPGGNDYIVYHAWDEIPDVGNRTGLIDKIIWTGGWPTIAGDKPSQSDQPYPN